MDQIDIHLKNASGVGPDLTIITLDSNIDIADIHFWDTNIEGKKA